ncbi:MAG: hypothetical protein ACLGHF_00050 [Alphaproteobacteria bacterium]
MKSALKIVAYTNTSETEGTIALLEVAIAAMARSGFKECAEMADMALHQFIEETVLRMACEDAPPEATRH